MFKTFIPGKRVGSVSLSGPEAVGKENRPQLEGIFASTTAVPTTTKNNVGAKVEAFQAADRNRMHKRTMTDYNPLKSPEEEHGMKEAFDKLLDDLQIPSSLRPKLDGMEANVKAAMVRSSQTLALTAGPGTPTKKMKPTLRRTRSIDSTMESPRRSSTVMGYEFPHPPESLAHEFDDGDLTPPVAPFMNDGGASAPQSVSSEKKIRRSSFGFRSSSQLHLPLLGSSNDAPAPKKEKPSSKDNKGPVKDTPAKFCDVLLSTSSLELDIEIVKKLRLMLRNESASWTETFIRQKGYIALLTRLNELLEVEWREEQHDDQLLHEILRCFKALSTSQVGCYALRSSAPTPFLQLTSLLYSDKKPGEVATRQLMIDLLLILFDLYPPSALPSTSSRPATRRREIWESSDEVNDLRVNDNLITLPAPHKTIFTFIRSLLLTPAPPPAEPPNSNIEPHEFIESLHVPRIYKTYLQELSDVCRDYFWVFCHPSNVLWNLSDVDESKAEKPRAPGGMTGGVEFEAMAYLTTHFKFVNAVSKAAADMNLPKEHELSAYKLHADFFASGMERVILVSRKASTTYYPTLHLELARYIQHAGKARYELPWNISRSVGLPPSNMCKPGRAPAKGAARSGAKSTPVTPVKKSHTARGSTTNGANNSDHNGSVPSGPQLPMPTKLDSLKIN